MEIISKNSPREIEHVHSTCGSRLLISIKDADATYDEYYMFTCPACNSSIGIRKNCFYQVEEQPSLTMRYRRASGLILGLAFCLMLVLFCFLWIHAFFGYNSQ